MTRFGGFLDSILDRYSDLILMMGLLLYYASINRFFYIVLTAVVMTGSVMVSYLRARSEGLGIENRGGIMTRPERVALLGIGLIVGHWVSPVILIVLAVIAGLAIFTTCQRLFHTWRSFRREEDQA